MSLIMDAQKAAQKERDRRTAGAAAGSVPLLVPLRSRGRSQIAWQRPLLFTAGGVAVLAAAAWLVLQSRDSVPRALRTPGPTLASISAPAPSAPQDAAPDKEISRVTQPDSAPPVARNTQPAATKSASLRTPVGKAKRPSRPAVQRAPAASQQRGQLVIEVEQPRAAEATRLFALGVAAQRAGDAATARAAYEQVLALSPNDVDALNNLGVLHTSIREFDRAESLLRRAIALAPTNAGAWNNLGAVLRDRGKPQDGIAAFQRALSLDPHQMGARVGLAQQYLVIGSLAQARQLLDEVLRDNPASPEANYALGQVRERQGDRKGAIDAYSAFVRFAPPGLAVYVENVRLRIEALTPRGP